MRTADGPAWAGSGGGRAQQPQYHNPFPQLARIAVLPFYNQTAEPTVDPDRIALAYYTELQSIRGFEVVPVGVTKSLLAASGIDPRSPEDSQRLAQVMGVDAVVVGSVTEYTPYYPPVWVFPSAGTQPIRITIPFRPGYGLPWGTAEEEFIPSDLVFEVEFALAAEQLKTQTSEFSS